MKVEVLNTTPISKDLLIEFDWEEIAGIYHEVFKELRKNLELPGFRKGRVPVQIAKTHLKSEVKSEVIERVLKENFEEIVEKSGVKDFLDFSVGGFQFEEQEPLEIKLTVEHDPEITLPDYQKGFKITRKKYIVDPESIEEVIERIKEEHSTITQVEGPVEEGNLVECDIQQLDEVSNMPIIGKKLTDKVIKVGEGIFGGPEAADLIGAMPGDNVKVRLPHQDGTTAPYQISIKKIHSQQVPVIDDEFVKRTYKNISTVEELKSNIAAYLEKEYEMQAEKEFQNEIKDYFVENSDFPVPPSRVRRYLDYIIEDYRRQYGDKNLDEIHIRNQYSSIAERTVRWYLIQKAIREKEQISVSEEEIEERIQQIKSQYSTEEWEKIDEYFKDPGNRLDLVWMILEEKIFDVLKKYAKEKIEKVHTKDLYKRGQG